MNITHREVIKSEYGPQVTVELESDVLVADRPLKCHLAIYPSKKGLEISVAGTVAVFEQWLYLSTDIKKLEEGTLNEGGVFLIKDYSRVVRALGLPDDYFTVKNQRVIKEIITPSGRKLKRRVPVS